MSEKQEVAKKIGAGKKTPGGRKPLANKKQNEAYSFFGEEADGWNMTPKTILLFSVAYMGTVILLHIFSKVASIKSKEVDPTAAGDLWME